MLTRPKPPAIRVAGSNPVPLSTTRRRTPSLFRLDGHLARGAVPSGVRDRLAGDADQVVASLRAQNDARLQVEMQPRPHAAGGDLRRLGEHALEPAVERPRQHRDRARATRPEPARPPPRRSGARQVRSRAARRLA